MRREDLIQIVESVWATMLGAPIQPASLDDDSAGDGAAALTASIYLKGACPGMLSASCSVEFAQHVASSMFGAPLCDTADELARDAMGEIVNIVGGNVKALLASSCELSLPQLREGDLAAGGDTASNTELLDLVSFEYEGERMTMRLWRVTAAAQAG